MPAFCSSQPHTPFQSGAIALEQFNRRLRGTHTAVAARAARGGLMCVPLTVHHVIGEQ